jgi:hypothetical protein
VYHYSPSVALDELKEEAVLPNPVHVRDMILRSQLTPEEALDLNREFQAYQRSFADAQKLADLLLGHLAKTPRKP